MVEKSQQLAEQLRAIKRSLHGVMNGTVSQSMRNKGLTYKVNFGVELHRLREMAEELPHSAELAALMWKENIRECRLWAAMIFPPEEFGADLADLWVEQMNFQEEAECTVMHLFQHLPFASQKAFEWIAREEEFFQLCGWLLLGRLFMKGMYPSDRDAEELLDQWAVALRSEFPAVAQAAQKALLKYMDLGEKEAEQGDRLLDALEKEWETQAAQGAAAEAAPAEIVAAEKEEEV